MFPSLLLLQPNGDLQPSHRRPFEVAIIERCLRYHPIRVLGIRETVSANLANDVTGPQLINRALKLLMVGTGFPFGAEDRISVSRWPAKPS